MFWKYKFLFKKDFNLIFHNYVTIFHFAGQNKKLPFNQVPSYIWWWETVFSDLYSTKVSTLKFALMQVKNNRSTTIKRSSGHGLQRYTEFKYEIKIHGSATLNKICSLRQLPHKSLYCTNMSNITVSMVTGNIATWWPCCKQIRSIAYCCNLYEMQYW